MAADFPYGTAVVYEDPAGVVAPMALIAVKEGGAKADLVVMSSSGTWSLVPDVPRSADGGKHSWRSVVETS